MAIQSASHVPLSVAREGHAQAVRRHQYYRELYDSGRWRHYGDEAKIKRELEQAAAEEARWQAILKASEAADANRSRRHPEAGIHIHPDKNPN